MTDNIDHGRIIFKINDVVVNLPNTAFRFPEACHDQCLTCHTFKDELKCWAEDAIDAAVDQCGGDVFEALKQSRPAMHNAIIILHACDRTSHVTLDYYYDGKHSEVGAESPVGGVP